MIKYKLKMLLNKNKWKLKQLIYKMICNYFK